MAPVTGQLRCVLCALLLVSVGRLASLHLAWLKRSLEHEGFEEHRALPVSLWGGDACRGSLQGSPQGSVLLKRCMTCVTLSPG